MSRVSCAFLPLVLLALAAGATADPWLPGFGWGFDSPPPPAGPSPPLYPAPPYDGSPPAGTTPPFDSPPYGGSPPAGTTPPSESPPYDGSPPGGSTPPFDSPPYGGTPPAGTTPPFDSPPYGGTPPAGTTPSVGTPPYDGASPPSSGPSGSPYPCLWSVSTDKWPAPWSPDSVVGDAFGKDAEKVFGGTSLLDGILSTGKDGFSSLLREGITALLNSADKHFQYTEDEVKKCFSASLISEDAASTQALKFQSANERFGAHF